MRSAFGLHQIERALHRRVVPDLAGAAHAADDVLLLEKVPEMSAGVLTSLAMHRPGRLYQVHGAADARRHKQGDRGTAQLLTERKTSTEDIE